MEQPKCTAEAPKPELPGYWQHEFEFSHEANSDHGDEIWYCKHCRKRWVKEGADY